MRMMDMLLAIPGLLLAIGIVALDLPIPRIYQIMIADQVTNIPIFARLLRGSILAQRDNDFVLAARAVGVRRQAILFSHPPERAGPRDRAGAPRARDRDHRRGRARLSRTRGRRIRPPRVGNMLADAQDYLSAQPFLAIFPALPS